MEEKYADTPVSALIDFVKQGGTLSREEELRIITHFEDTLNRIAVVHAEMAMVIDEACI